MKHAHAHGDPGYLCVLPTSKGAQEYQQQEMGEANRYHCMRLSHAVMPGDGVVKKQVTL